MKPKVGFGQALLYLVVVLVLAFILLPLVAVVLDSFNSVTYSVFPTVGFSLQWYSKALFSGYFAAPFTYSAIIAITATLISVGIGFFASLALVRHEFKGKGVLSVFFLSPLIFPTFIFGLGSLIFFFDLGIFGSFESILVAHVVIVSPYVIRVLSSSLVSFDQRLEEAAQSLGANRFVTYTRVTLPMILPGLVAASMFSFVISFDEIAATIFLLRPTGFVTLPVAMFNYVETYNDPTIAALSTLLMLLSVAILVVGQKVTKTSFFGTFF